MQVPSKFKVRYTSDMSDLMIEKIERLGEDGSLVDFGPRDLRFFDLRIPRILRRRLTYSADLTVDLFCQFSGERLEISELRVRSRPGEFLKTSLLTQLGLPVALRQIFLTACPDTDSLSNLPALGELDKLQRDVVVAQIYWFEFASWGNPRKRVTDYTGWSNNNANSHFRRLAKEYGLPGHHAKKTTGN
jgi:hypothetical protein